MNSERSQNFLHTAEVFYQFGSSVAYVFVHVDLQASVYDGTADANRFQLRNCACNKTMKQSSESG